MPLSYIVSGFFGHPEVPNQMRLVAERPPRSEQERYLKSRRQAAVYRAASKLWAKGLPMKSAIELVESAMRDAGEI